MSDGEGKRSSRVYFTRGRAREEASSSGGEESDPFHYQDWAQQLSAPLPSIPEGASGAVNPGEVQQQQGVLQASLPASDVQASTSGLPGQTPPDVQGSQVSAFQQYVSQQVKVLLGSLYIQRSVKTTARKQLVFNPLLGSPKPKLPKGHKQLAIMQNPPPPPPPQNPQVKAAKFKGKSKEDPDCHVGQFDTRWHASGYHNLYGDVVKLQQFAATLEGAAMTWYSQFAVGHFGTYDALKIAFLGRFRTEKTPNDLIKKIKKIKQGTMLVEDFAQKFRSLVGRLQGRDQLSDEMMATYFLKGLNRVLRTSVANVDLAGGFDELVNAATRVEKRLGKAKAKNKRKKRDDSDTESESDSSDDEDDSSDSESDSDDSDKEGRRSKRKKSSSKKQIKQKGKSNKSKGADSEQLLEKLKALGYAPPAGKDKPFCQICEKEGHLTANCWYNPNYRGRIPGNISKKQSPPLAETNQILPTHQNRNYNRPVRPFYQRQNWQPQDAGTSSGVLKCTYCDKEGHKCGPDCELWCKHREERGVPVVKYPQGNRGGRPTTTSSSKCYHCGSSGAVCSRRTISESGLFCHNMWGSESTESRWS